METQLHRPDEGHVTSAKVTSRRAGAWRGSSRYYFERRILPWLLLLPLLTVVVAVIGYPIVNTFVLSLHQGENLRTGAFTGLDNYTQIFQDPDYIAALVRTTIFAALTVTATIIISLCLAILIDSARRGATVLAVIVLLPWAMPRVATGIIWKWLFNDQYGVINWVLVKLGMGSFKGYSWFTSSTPAMVAITATVIWGSVPFVAISLYAGLRANRKDLIEAARVDGANAFQVMMHIRLPLIKPLIRIMTVISTIWAYQSFDQFFVMTTPPGGPNHGTEVLSLLVWLKAFAQLDGGTAAAMAVVMFVLLGAITAVYARLSKEETQ